MSNPEALARRGLEAVVATAFNRYDYDASGNMVRLHLFLIYPSRESGRSEALVSPSEPHSEERCAERQVGAATVDDSCVLHDGDSSQSARCEA